MRKILNINFSEAKIISLKSNYTKVSQKYDLINKLIISSSEGYRFIEYHDIIRLESLSNYTKIFTVNNKSYIVSKTMKSILQKLPKLSFLRVHNSHVINVHEIELLSKDQIRMSDNRYVPISRNKRKMVLERLGCE